MEKFKILDIQHSKMTDITQLKNKLRELLNDRTEIDLKFRENGSPATLVSQKQAIRLKNFSVGQVHNSPYQFIRSRYTNKFILPQTFSSVYLLPTFQKDQRIFIINFSKICYSLFTTSHFFFQIFLLIASERAKKFKLSDLLASLINFDDFNQSVIAPTTQNESCSDSQIKDSNSDSGFIWIPQFSSTSEVLFNQQLVDTFQDRSEPSIHSVITISSELSFILTIQVCALSKIEMVYPSKASNLRVDYQEEEILIKNDFVVGIVNKELLKFLNMPVFMTLIKQEQFLKSDLE